MVMEILEDYLQMNHLFYFVYLYDQNIGFLFEKVEGGLLPCHFYNWSPVFVPDKEWNKDYTNYLVYFPCASEISFIVEIKISNTNKIVRFFRTEYIENFIDKTKLKNLFWKIYTKYWGRPEIYEKGQLNWLSEVGILETNPDVDPHIEDVIFFEL